MSIYVLNVLLVKCDQNGRTEYLAHAEGIPFYTDEEPQDKTGETTNAWARVQEYIPYPIAPPADYDPEAIYFVFARPVSVTEYESFILYRAITSAHVVTMCIQGYANRRSHEHFPYFIHDPSPALLAPVYLDQVHHLLTKLREQYPDIDTFSTHMAINSTSRYAPFLEVFCKDVTL
jgi:hypothetical protein